MRRSVGAKLTVVLLVIALIPAAVAFTVGGSVLRTTLQAASNETRQTADAAIVASLEREGNALASAFAEQIANPLVADDFAAMKRIAKDLRDVPQIERAEVAAADGTLVADGTDRPALRRMRSRDAVPEEEVAVRQEPGALVVARRIEAGDRTLGWVTLALSTDVSREAQGVLSEQMARTLGEGESALLRTSSVAGFAMILIVALVAAYLARRLTRPIVALRDATHRVGEGDLAVRVPVKSEDEIGMLARSFNAMTEDLSQARRALADKARLERELEIAAQIQTSLLPPNPTHPDLEFHGRMEPADEVGGDFYDVQREGDGQALWITIGDVSSHGLGAGLVMLMVQSQIASMFAADPTMGPDVALRRVNRLLYANVQERLRDDKYVTVRLFAYRGQGVFEYAGGHEWPIVWRAATGKCEQIDAEGPWLGILPELPPTPVARIELAPGDVLCLYTDGIVETMDRSGVQFEARRMTEALEEAARNGASLAGMADAIFGAVERYGEQDDDRTMLLVRRV